MKYQITLDNKENKNSPYILYDLRHEELVLENPELDLTVSKVGKLSFSIYSDHPYFDKLEKKSSKLSVLKNGRTIFRGRIIEDEQGLYNDKSVLCESALAYLNDSIVRPGEFSGSPLEFLTMLLDNHNSQVADEQKLLLGNVTVEDPNNYISRSWIDYLKTWEVLEKRGIDLIGGYVVERYEEDGTYIDWLNDFNDTSTQIIEFGENIIDIFAKNSANNTYTVAIPLGAEIENEDGTKTRLTIESVNDGLDYIVNQAALNKYGWIVAPVNETTWDDVTLASNLKTKCENWLNNQGVMIESEFEITALDLQATDKNIESFFICEYVRIKSKPHNIDKVLLLSSIKIPLAHPENTQITVGESVNSLTGIELGNKQNIDNVIDRIGTIEKNYELNEELINQEIDEIRQEVINNTSLIEQTDTQIRLDVAEEYVSTGTFSEFRETTETQFTVQADGIEAKFSEMVLMVETVEGETQAQFRELASYIRGYQNGEGQPVLELGSVTSDIILRQTNDRIQFIQNGTEVAYVSNNTLFITDGEFLNSLRIGQFAFIPRANGSLDFKKVSV